MNDRISRRNLLGLAGAGVASSLVGRFLLDASTALADTGGGPAPKAKSCIVLWMNGGPSHIDTFDPKSGGSSAGPFKSIATRAPGIEISEHLPMVAEQGHRLAILRGMTSKEGNHQRAQEYGRTSYAPNPTVSAPSIGAWVAHKRAAPALEIPAFVSLGGPSIGAGILGSSADPFVVQRPGSMPDDMTPALPASEARRKRRLALLEEMDSDFAKRTGDAQVDARQGLYARSTRMMKSSAAKAFDIESEPESVRARYGDSDFGRGCLVARRLVEASVPFVEVTLDGWDTHDDGFDRVKKLSSKLDPAMASLIRELDERGALDSTLIVWMGEFGRTPRISGNDGRDHHPAAWSAVLAGGGIRGGVVHGETDAEGSAVVKDPTRVPDLLATIASRVGVDPGYVAFSATGRPISVTDGGKVLDVLVKRPP